MTEHLIVKAGAGTGKTFCVTEGVYRQHFIPRTTVGSPEQQAVWAAMMSDPYPGRTHMTSFTTDAAEQLEEKCPKNYFGKSKVTSSSTYGMGYRFAREHGEGGNVDRFGNKYKGLTTEVLGGNKFECDQKCPHLWDAVHEIQGKARLALKRKVTEKDVKDIATYFGVELPYGRVDDVEKGVNTVLEGGRSMSYRYDFTDMVYLPVIKGMVYKRYDTLVVDEFQDMGRAQQELCLLVSFRRILIGDPHQAIYGFAGADQSAFDRIETYLGNTVKGVKILPLTETRRCAKSIVRRANKIVPELKAMDSAPEGNVISYSRKAEFYENYLPKIKTTYGQAGFIGDTDQTMIICPTNAPLIGLMFKLKKEGIQSYVHGKDVTESMLAFVTKFDKGIGELRLELLRKLEQFKARRASKSTDIQIDIYSAMHEIANECTTVKEVENAISNIFSDSPRPGWMKLSSIHKSKGLEAGTIIVWEMGNCKSKYSELPWQYQQDINLEYVGITRAKHTLVEVWL